MATPETGQDRPADYIPSYIPAGADPQQQRYDVLCFDIPFATYERAVAATHAAVYKGQTKEQWMTVRDTLDATIQLYPKSTLVEGDGGHDDLVNHHNVSPLLNGPEPEDADRLAPLLGDVQVTWRSSVEGISVGQSLEDVLFEVRRASVRRKLAGILPLGRPQLVARVTGYTARREPKGSESRNYTRPES